MKSAPRVIVSHNGRQHSHQTSLALHSAGMLKEYWSGVPCFFNNDPGLRNEILKFFIYYSDVSLPKELVKWFPIAPILNRVGKLTGSMALKKIIEYKGYSMFDAWASRQLSGTDFDMVIAYENNALQTFKAAKKNSNTITILDAASFHYTTQDMLCPPEENEKTHREINLHKKKEIELADHILTVSELAAESYIKAGVPKRKIHIIPVGVDLSLFQASSEVTGDRSKIVFLSVASEFTERKGLDLILEAFSKLSFDGCSPHLRLVGSANLDLKRIGRENPNIQVLGRLSQSRLVEEYQSADCFILPSRQDSFGMVVPEALACGLPVILSESVGAKQLINEDESGWVINLRSSKQLRERMEWCANNRDFLLGMKLACCRAAQNASWEKYHERLIETIKDIANTNK